MLGSAESKKVIG